MPFDIDNDNSLNPAIRFDWPEDQSGEWIELRLPSEADKKTFFEKAGVKEKVEYRTDKKTRMIQRITFFDSTPEQRDQYDEELWDFMIANWNMITPSDDHIPCTRENKVKLMRRSPRFRTWIDSCIEKMEADILRYQESIEKN